MKKIVLTPKAKKIAMITGITVVVCAGVLSFVLLQHADAKSEKLYTVSSTVITAVRPSSSSASSEISGISSRTNVSSASKRSNCSAVCSSTSGTVTSPKTTDAPSPKTKTNDSPKTKSNDRPSTKTRTNDSPKSAVQDKPSEKTSDTTPVKPSEGTPAPKPPVAPTVTPYNISADQQAIIAYGESKGLTYNPNLRPEHSSWAGRSDLLVDVGSDTDIIDGCKSDIDGMIRVGYSGADFNPYFEKKSDKTNDYYSYVLYR